MIAVPYIILVLYFFFLHYTSNSVSIYRYSEKFSIYFTLWIFLGFRGYVFTDCFGYASFFDSVPDIITIFKTQYLRWAFWEPGFVCYCGIIKLFTQNWFVFQMIDTAIDLVLLYKSLEYFEANRGMTLTVFLAMSGLISFIDLFRNIKSILIFFYSLRYVLEKKVFKYYMCCIIAFLFHKSSIIFFMCYPILSLEISRRKFLFLGFLGLVLAFFSSHLFLSFAKIAENFLSPFFQKRLVAYVTGQSSYTAARFISLGTIEKVVSFILIYGSFNVLKQDKKSIIFVKVFSIYFFLYFAFFGFNELSSRASLLFIFCYWYLIPKIITFQRRQNQYLYVIAILIYCVLKMSLYNQPVQRYENWLFGASSYSERLRIMRAR